MRNRQLLYLLLALITSSCAKNEALQVYDLRCEYLSEPLGIDNPYEREQIIDFKTVSPRLSWKVEGKSEAGRQFSYRVVLENRGNAIWDSGEVESVGQHCFIPQGELQANSVYYWKTQICTKENGELKWSKWSKKAKFTTGLQKDDWQGAWIFADSTVDKKQHLWFAKEFDVQKVPENVFAYVASIGYHELYVNGQKADERVLAPAVSRLDKRVFYVTYDIAKLLKKGKNTVSLAYGPGWAMNNYFAYYKVKPAIRVQIYDEARQIALSSDTTWRIAEGYSQNYGKFNFMNMGGELLDGRRFSKDFQKGDFDGLEKDKDWKYASVQALEKEPILSAQMTDASKIVEEISPQKLTLLCSPPGKAVWRVDMGKEFTGFLEAKFDCLQRGDTVVIQISMRDSANVYVQATDSIGNQIIEEQNQRQIYIARGEKGETFRNRFNFFAGRYIHIWLKPVPRTDNEEPYLQETTEPFFKLKNIKGLAVSSAPEYTAKIETSDTLFNQLAAMDKYTFQMCHTECVTVDCPNRERLGYGPEGAYQTMSGLGLPCFNSAAYYVKNLRDWADVQFDNGFINNVAPQVSQMYGCVLNGTAILNIALEHYGLYHDLRVLEFAEPVGKKWLDFLGGYVKDDMLTPYETHGYFLGEWVSPGPVFEYGGTEEALCFNNCAYAMALWNMGTIRALVSEGMDGAFAYFSQIEKLRLALHKKYYNPETNTFLNGDQVRTSFAIQTLLFNRSLHEKLENHLSELLEKQGYIDVGSFGRYPFWQTVLENKKDISLISHILQKKTYPSYGYFIEKGCTTFPEMWEIDCPNSTLIHTSYTGISAFFMRGLAGINADGSIIRPQIVDNLNYCIAEKETPFGRVKSAWRKEGDKIKYSISIPFGTEARIILPRGNNDDKKVGAGDHTFYTPI
ncbi:MAG: glycoside hydrolase family 78 protein [Dysgonamonadaceae bacterium]|jgi:alpha-L-rhamnosidase|nr:glycoside hydrolase family 78 protein [Dysgonamonadaceae bacterium]